ncbi:hypothetical protein [Yersinia enterocolitica]|uniref:hypothetical protein n=1 Tax=Yersinia enterocolitica TaxID=630 RepID=UPI003D791E39
MNIQFLNGVVNRLLSSDFEAIETDDGISIVSHSERFLAVLDTGEVFSRGDQFNFYAFDLRCENAGSILPYYRHCFKQKVSPVSILKLLFILKVSNGSIVVEILDSVQDQYKDMASKILKH